MQNSKENGGRLHNRVAAGKPPVGGLPKPSKKWFCKFCDQTTIKQLNS